MVVALRLVITFLFVPAILDRLIDPDEYARLFVTWGYPRWGAFAVSCVEIIGLVGLWIPRVAAAARVLVMITLCGATGTWLVHGPRSTAAYPGTILILVAALAWLEARGRV